jgi:ankyrin repeat protein
VRLLQPLLDAGADPTILTKNGRNAFHYAAKSDNARDLLAMLIQHL